MSEVMSPQMFKWFVTLATVLGAVITIILDSIRLSRQRAADKRDPVVRDKVFGYVIGLVIAVIGFIGCLKFHDVM